MNPKQFEEFVCEYFRERGYEAKTTSDGGDYGVDVFATKGNEFIAVQAKMYGSGTRKINRQMVMELHGAKDYFGCTKAIIATTGILLSDAIHVANKLKIDILSIDCSVTPGFSTATSNDRSSDSIWEGYIMPLKGKTLMRDNGKTNEILNVDWSELERITSNGRKGKIKIEIFRAAINKLLKDGSITRDEINQNYVGRASSGVLLILAQIPFFHITDSPRGLKYVK